MKIAQHPGRWPLEHRRERVAPERDDRPRACVSDPGAEFGRYQSSQQFHLDQQRVQVVTRQSCNRRPLDRQSCGNFSRCSAASTLHRRLVARFDRRRRLPGGNRFVAEILDDQQAGVAVGVENRRRGKSALAQAERHGDERRHVFGEMRDRAVGLAVAHRRSVRPLRRIHQDVARAIEREPLIGARRGIALDAPAVGGANPARVEEAADRERCARRARASCHSR